MNQKSGIGITRFTKGYNSKYFLSMLFSAIGVAFGLFPFLAVAKIAVNLVENNSSTSFYIWACVVMLAGYILKTICLQISTAISHTATFNVLSDIRYSMMDKLKRMPMGDVQNIPSGQLKDIIVDKVEGFEKTLAHLVPELTGNLFVSFAVVIYLFIVDWRIALLALTPILLGFMMYPFMMIDYEKQFKAAVETGRRMNNAIVEYINGIEVIKTFNQSEKSYKKYSDAVLDNASVYYNWMKKCQVAMSLGAVLCPATLLTVLPVGTIFYIQGTIELAEYITCIILSLSIVEPIMKCMGYSDDLAIVGDVMGQITSILDAPELVRPKKSEEIIGNDIKIENVSFAYNEENGDVLKNINLDIMPKSITAIVGPSGSGKSTISKLIAGLWDCSKGNIFIGGKNIKDISQKELSNKVTYVSQDNYLFNLSVMENIRIAKPDATDEEVYNVSKKACCDTFISNLENGYNTIVGDGGSHLSGGERQRIALARAMLKDTPIVILDEATAYIDTENEAIMQEAIGKLIKDKTVIIVAHRLSTIMDSDKIVVVNMGEIIAEGKHYELLDKCELYKDMWNSHIAAREGTLC